MSRLLEGSALTAAVLLASGCEQKPAENDGTRSLCYAAVQSPISGVDNEARILIVGESKVEQISGRFHVTAKGHSGANTESFYTETYVQLDPASRASNMDCDQMAEKFVVDNADTYPDAQPFTIEVDPETLQDTGPNTGP